MTTWLLPPDEPPQPAAEKWRPPLETPELQALREAWSEMAVGLQSENAALRAAILRLEGTVDSLRARLEAAIERADRP